MSVVVLDLVDKDASAIRADIEKAVADAESAGERVSHVSTVLEGRLLVVVSLSPSSGGAAAELERFKRLLDAGAIDVFDFRKAKERLLSTL